MSCYRLNPTIFVFLATSILVVKGKTEDLFDSQFEFSLKLLISSPTIGPGSLDVASIHLLFEHNSNFLTCAK